MLVQTFICKSMYACLSTHLHVKQISTRLMLAHTFTCKSMYVCLSTHLHVTKYLQDLCWHTHLHVNLCTTCKPMYSHTHIYVYIQANVRARERCYHPYAC